MSLSVFKRILLRCQLFSFVVLSFNAETCPAALLCRLFEAAAEPDKLLTTTCHLQMETAFFEQWLTSW